MKTRENKLNESFRAEALKWFNSKSLEVQFYLTIKHNDLIVGDKTRHPHTLTGREIELIWIHQRVLK